MRDTFQLQPLDSCESEVGDNNDDVALAPVINLTDQSDDSSRNAITRLVLCVCNIVENTFIEGRPCEGGETAASISPGDAGEE